MVNLTFHGIGERRQPLNRGEQSVWLSQQSFEDILDAVRLRDDVRITFDDGNISDLELGVPALVDRGLSATFFVLAGRIGQAGSLGRRDLAAIRAAGMTIGSHGMYHRPWREVDHLALEEELVQARKMLEDVIGDSIRQAACPFGSYGRKPLRRLRELGYDHVFTSDRGWACPDAWLQPRNTLHREDDNTIVQRLVAPQRLWGRLVRRVAIGVKQWR